MTILTVCRAEGGEVTASRGDGNEDSWTQGRPIVIRLAVGRLSRTDEVDTPAQHDLSWAKTGAASRLCPRTTGLLESAESPVVQRRADSNWSPQVRQRQKEKEEKAVRQHNTLG
ncbi:unnamed protein product [Protopolystoma xenopodis]|uniref:Uncharacterized protein n=1 Tax=Protopolystoma xenopodis TaxID=117903 RepID=A0A3S5AUM3_9PLAT|nr:unnamed protein product [Protopolystoma xenopodis]